MINISRIFVIFTLCFLSIACVKDIKSNIEAGSASKRISASDNNTQPLFDELK
ncbi:hypothetical protein N8772_03665 [Rickettsiales bacterium]|nr:hypothetical protein [Rickettsiales bacterium]